MKSLKQLTFMLFLVTLGLLLVNFIHAEEIQPVFNTLINRLEKDGMDKKYLKDLFTRPELDLLTEAVAMSLIRKETNLNYAQFLTKESLERAASYLKAHDKTLKKMENHFGVSAPVVVAILSVETAFGKFLGSFDTVNILITQSLSLKPEVYQTICDRIPTKEKANLTHREIKKRLEKKSSRAYTELKALLTYVKARNIDPFMVKGSPEGAIGLPQFLPSNIKRYGFDGNGDDEIDLFHHEDAIASVASYLKAHKWREDSNYKKKREVILKYNNSVYYARTVLTLAERLSQYWH